MKKWNRKALARRALTLATVAVGAAWIASRWIGVYYGSDEFGLAVGISGGAFDLFRGIHEFGQELVGWRLMLGKDAQFNWFSASGSWVWLPARLWIHRYQVLLIPLWIPLLPCSIGAAWMWWRKLRSRSVAGACAKCGYDRAGLADHAPCPECGKQAEQQLVLAQVDGPGLEG